MQQYGLLQHHTDLRPQRLQGPLADVLAINEDRALDWVIEAGDQRGQGSFAGAGGPDEGRHLPGWEGERESFEHGLLWVIGKGDVAELNAALQSGGRPGAREVDDALFDVQEFHHPLHLRSGSSNPGDVLDDRAQGLVEVAGVVQEDD